MHSCSGITDNTRSWAGRLVGWGYAAVIVDGFGHAINAASARAWTSLQTARRCAGRPQRRDLSAHFAQHPGRPDRDRSAALTVAGRPPWAAIDERIPVDRGGRPFQAAVAYYPHVRAGRSWSRLPRTCCHPGRQGRRLNSGRPLPQDGCGEGRSRRPLPSRSIPVRCTASTLAACPWSPVPAIWLAAIPKRRPNSFRDDEGFP